MDMEFQYEPLDLAKPSIRLIRVLPRRDDGEIACEIVAVERPATYSALSYNWGPPGDEHAITLISSETGQTGTTRVRRNLFEFLLRASATEEYRRQRWWIDALCIDQVRVDERNHQVQQMDTIYTGAKRVHIWLGIDHSIARVFTLLHRYQKIRFTKSFDADKFSRKFIHDHLCLKGISRLRSHSYWSRLWIIQEVLLSEELLVVAGHFSIPWECLSVLEEIVQLADASADKPLANRGVPAPVTPQSAASNLIFLLTHRPRHQEQRHGPCGHELDLIELLKVSATSVCQDVRDKMYGVLSLIPNDLRISVDYQIGVNDLFLKACSFYECWTDPGRGLGLVRRLADALQIDLQTIATVLPSSVDHMFIIEPVELERRFGRGTYRRLCTQCGADLAWAIGRLAPSDLVEQVWCISMGDHPWLHVFFDHGQVPQSLKVHAIAAYESTGGPTEESQLFVRWWSDLLQSINQTEQDCTSLGSSGIQNGTISKGEFRFSQQSLLLIASIGQ